MREKPMRLFKRGVLGLSVLCLCSCSLHWLKPERPAFYKFQKRDVTTIPKGTLELNSTQQEVERAKKLASEQTDLKTKIVTFKQSEFIQCYSSESEEKIDSKEEEKWIVILYSRSGSGHVSAAEAVRTVLQNPKYGRPYNVALVDIVHNMTSGLEPKFDEYLKDESWVRLQLFLTLKPLGELKLKLSGQEELKKRMFGACKSVSGFKETPTAVVSVFPFANHLYWKTLMDNEPRIPFVIVPTDFDPAGFVSSVVYNVQRDIENYRNWTWISLPWYTPYPIINPNKPQRKLASTASVVEEMLYSATGYPLREPMTVKKSKQARREQITRNLRKQDPGFKEIVASDLVLAISLGGKGGSYGNIESYINALNNTKAVTKILNKTKKKRLVLVVADGGNQEIQTKTLEKAKQVSLFALAPTGRLNGADMADLIGGSNLVIGKPGGSTVAEVLALRTPMLVRSNSTVALFWERYNYAVLVDEGWGIRTSRKNPDLINSIIDSVKLKGLDNPVFTNFNKTDTGFRFNLELFLSRLAHKRQQGS